MCSELIYKIQDIVLRAVNKDAYNERDLKTVISHDLTLVNGFEVFEGNSEIKNNCWLMTITRHGLRNTNRPEVSISIALYEEGNPVLNIVYVSYRAEFYVAEKDNCYVIDKLRHKTTVLDTTRNRSNTVVYCNTIPECLVVDYDYGCIHKCNDLATLICLMATGIIDAIVYSDISTNCLELFMSKFEISAYAESCIVKRRGSTVL